MPVRESRASRVLEPVRRGLSGRVQGLDGIRGLAVTFVVMSHAQVPLFGPGGIVGVTMFFTLSGFLITGLLLREFDRTGRIDLPAFWGRRVVRLLPALYVCVAAVSVALLVTHRVHLGSLAKSDLAVLFYYANFSRVAGQLITPLGHTWSLAIEEQFYLVWPLVLGALLLLLRRRRYAFWALLSVFVVLTLLSAASRVASENVLFPWTTVFSMTAGAALALLHRRGWRPGRWAMPVSAVAVVALLVAMQRPARWGGWLWGPIWYSALSLLLIACVSGEARTLFSWTPLRLLGLVSYGWYLWHYPLFWFVFATGEHPRSAGAVSVAVLASLAVAFVSWLVVEQPIQRRFKPRLERARLRPPDSADSGDAETVGVELEPQAQAAAPTLQPQPSPAVSS